MAEEEEANLCNVARRLLRSRIPSAQRRLTQPISYPLSARPEYADLTPPQSHLNHKAGIKTMWGGRSYMNNDRWMD